MAWPTSADALIATAETQTSNVDAFASDVLAASSSTVVTYINGNVLTTVPDPTWVDPGDGSEAPQIPDTYTIEVIFKSVGTFSAENVEKLLEVRKALGL